MVDQGSQAQTHLPRLACADEILGNGENEIMVHQMRKGFGNQSSDGDEMK